MSIGLGVRCKDGIVLGCDSASTLVLGPEMTRPDQGKYFKVTDRIQLIGTGGYTDGVRLVREIQGRLPNHPDVMSTKDFEVILEDSALALHTRYNLDQDPPIRDGNDPRCDGASIICFGNVGGDLGLYVVLGSGDVEFVSEWHPVGSLAPVTEYLLQRLCRPNINLQIGLKIAAYVVSEIIDADPYCGGRIRLGYLERGGQYVDFEDDDIKEIDHLVQERRTLLHGRIFKHVFDDQFNLHDF